MRERFFRPTAPKPESRVITSLTNPLVKDVRALAMRKTREEAGLFVAEGLKLVADGVARGWEITALLHGPGETKPIFRQTVTAARRAGAEIVECSREVLEKIARRDNPQTVIGVFRQRLIPLADVKPSPDALWIGLDRVRDPGNLGTIIRTADAVGAEGVMLIGEATDPFGMEAVRATMGSIFAVRLASGSAAEFLRWKAGYRGRIVGTHLKGKTDYRDVDYSGPRLLLMGNEQQGLPDEIAEACEDLVRIPMRAGADSLNLAVATGVMLFEMVRGRG